MKREESKTHQDLSRLRPKSSSDDGENKEKDKKNEEENAGQGKYESGESGGKNVKGSKAMALIFAAVVVILLFSIALVTTNTQSEGQKNNTRNQERKVSSPTLPIIGIDKLVKPSNAFPFLMGRRRLYSLLSKRNQTDKLELESWLLHDYIEHVMKLNKTVFKAVPNSFGIVTSCQISHLCMMNLIYLLDFMHTDTPVELWLNKDDKLQSLIIPIPQRWQDRLTIKFIEDVQTQYVAEFGEAIRAGRPYRLLF